MTLDSLEKLVQKFNLKKPWLALNGLTVLCSGFRSARCSGCVARNLQTVAA